MGKVRVKSFIKAKRTAAVQARQITVEDLKKPTSIPKSALHDVSGGRIIKAAAKKSVTFRSNLTDIVSSEHVSLKPALSSGAEKSAVVDPLKKILESTLSGRKRKIMKKAERLKEKRMSFFKRVEAMKVKAKEEKEAAKRKAIPIIGDTMALMDALESVEQDLMQSEPVAPISTETQKKTKKKFSAKKRQREIAEGLEYFASALQRP